MDSNDVIIRNMQPKDIEACSYIMSHAFGSKLQSLGKLSVDETAEFLAKSGIFNRENLSMRYVAEVDGKIAGYLQLDTKQNRKTSELGKTEGRYLVRKYGFFRVMTAGISAMFLTHPLKADELLVDNIAVHPDYRGRGIGGSLLDYGEQQAKHTKGVLRYTLEVIGRNEGAKRLYERKGFRVISTHRPIIARLFTGVRMYHKMSKTL